MFRYLQKLTYIVGVPAVCLTFGYKIYQKRILFEQRRVQRIEALSKNLPLDVRVLRNFNSSIFMISLDSSMNDPSPLDVAKIYRIARMMSEIQPDQLFLEISGQRYESQFQIMVLHPRFDLVIKSISQFVKEVKDDIQDEVKLKKKVDEWIYRNKFHHNFVKAVQPRTLEILVALELCKFKQAGTCRVSPIDRGQNLTFKKLMSRISMRTMVEDSQSQKKKKGHKKSKQQISEIEEMLRGWDDHVSAKLMNPTTRELSKDGILSLSQEEKDYRVWQKQVMKAIETSEEKQKEQLESIYKKVLIDEVNEVLVNNIQKKVGQVAVLLVNGERAESLEQMWRAAYTDYYLAVESKEKVLSD